MREKQYREFLYIVKDDYDKKLKINSEDLPVYSKKKLKELYPEKDYVILGETFETKKRDKENDIGRIELNEKRLYVSENGKHNKLFKKQGAFVEAEGGGFIALLKIRLLPIILIIALLLGVIAGCLLFFPDDNENPPDEEETQEYGDITPIEPAVLTITGIVTKDGKPIEDAKLSLQYGNKEISAASTDANGKYLINDVENGNYNLVCTYGNSVLTQNALVCGESITVNFSFPAGDDSDVKAIVKITDDKTPPVEVIGLSEEAISYMMPGKEVDLTLLATLLTDSEIPEEDKASIEALSGELEMTYYDFSVLKEIFENQKLESSEYLKNTKTVLEIAVSYDSSHSVATYAFRYHGGEALKMEALTEKPISDYKDGTYYVSADIVYIYTDCFSTYAIGAANTEQVVRGSDTITYSDRATVNLNTGKIDLLYKHDADSTNNAKVEVYLVGTSGNLLIAESAEIPVGYQLTGLQLKDGIKNMLSVGTYEGLMKIIYLGTDGAVSTNVDIPLTVAITK